MADIRVIVELRLHDDCKFENSGDIINHIHEDLINASYVNKFKITNIHQHFKSLEDSPVELYAGDIGIEQE